MNHARTMRRALGTLICASALVLAAQAQAVQDEGFMKKAAEGGLFEVQAGKLAEQSAANDQVKELAQKIAADHQAANDKLQSIAQSQNVTLPAKPANGRELKKLSSLKGEAFDKEYVKTMVKDHKHDISEFQKQASKGKNAEVKEFASGALPTLKDHLTLAQKAEQELKQKSAGSSGAGGKGQSK